MKKCISGLDLACLTFEKYRKCTYGFFLVNKLKRGSLYHRLQTILVYFKLLDDNTK